MTRRDAILVALGNELDRHPELDGPDPPRQVVLIVPLDGKTGRPLRIFLKPEYRTELT